MTFFSDYQDYGSLTSLCVESMTRLSRKVIPTASYLLSDFSKTPSAIGAIILGVRENIAEWVGGAALSVVGSAVAVRCHRVITRPLGRLVGCGASCGVVCAVVQKALTPLPPGEVRSSVLKRTALCGITIFSAMVLLPKLGEEVGDLAGSVISPWISEISCTIVGGFISIRYFGSREEFIPTRGCLIDSYAVKILQSMLAIKGHEMFFGDTTYSYQVKSFLIGVLSYNFWDLYRLGIKLHQGNALEGFFQGNLTERLLHPRTPINSDRSAHEGKKCDSLSLIVQGFFNPEDNRVRAGEHILRSLLQTNQIDDWCEKTVESAIRGSTSYFNLIKDDQMIRRAENEIYHLSERLIQEDTVLERRSLKNKLSVIGKKIKQRGLAVVYSNHMNVYGAQALGSPSFLTSCDINALVDKINSVEAGHKLGEYLLKRFDRFDQSKIGIKLSHLSSRHAIQMIYEAHMEPLMVSISKEVIKRSLKKTSFITEKEERDFYAAFFERAARHYTRVTPFPISLFLNVGLPLFLRQVHGSTLAPLPEIIPVD